MSAAVVIKDRAIFGVTPLSNRFIEAYMPSADENAVKVYVYGLMLVLGGADGTPEIASALGMTDEQVLDAYRYWEKQGIIRIASGENGNSIVQYLAVDNSSLAVASAPDSSARYAHLVGRVQQILGTRNLSGSELQKIYDWIDVFRFEEDAAIDIIAHCIDIKGARVHINYMDALAKRFAADGILTHEQVLSSFRLEAELSSGAAAILKRWRITRRPTEDELQLYEKWVKDWGFTDEAIGLACSDVVAIDRPNFKYLDAILSSYRENGSITTDEIHELIRKQDMLVELARQAFTRAGMKRTATSSDRRQFELWFNDYGMTAEMILYAAELASSKATPFAEMKRIIAGWRERGVANYLAARDDIEKTHAQARTASYHGEKGTNRALNYKQQKYSAEQLKQLGVDLGEDVYED